MPEALHMVVSKAICEIDGLRAHEDHCMPVGPTAHSVPSAILRSRAAATTFSNIG